MIKELMRKLSLLLILVSMTVLAISCITKPEIQTTPGLDPFNKIRTNGTNKHPVIIRLNNSLNQFYCTGFVIDGQYAMTAAHCLQNRWGNLKDDLIKVSDMFDNYVTEAKPVAIDKDCLLYTSRCV